MSTLSNTQNLSPSAHPLVGLPVETHPSFICPITLTVMKEPVIDPHGHTFEKEDLLKWLQTNTGCPINRQPLTAENLVPNRALQELIETSQRAPASTPASIQQIQQGREQNDTMAQPLLTSAQGLEQQGKLIEAEKFYLMALQFTTKSEDYAHLPPLYVKKNEIEKACNGYITLANLQIEEGKKEQAIDSLKNSLKLIAHPPIKERLAHLLKEKGKNQEASHLFLELAQQQAYLKNSHQAITFCNEALNTFPGWAEPWKILAGQQNDPNPTLLKGSREVTMPLEERITLVKMVLIKDPEHIQGQLQLLTLKQQKTKEKVKQLKRKIASLQGPVIAAPPALPSSAFGAAQWKTYFGDVGVEPPLPPNIEAILNAPCPFWPSKKVQETHLLTLIPATVDGKPLTLKRLGELLQRPLKESPTQYRGFYIGEYIDAASPKSHWALMTRDVIEGSRNKPYSEQQKLIQPPYEVPTVLDAAVTILMEYVKSGTRLYSDSPWTFTRCQEKYDEDDQLVVGGFSAAGLSIRSHSLDDGFSGIGGLRIVS